MAKRPRSRKDISFENRNLKQRARLYEAGQESEQLAVFDSGMPGTMNTGTTDYTPDEKLSSMPLKLRERKRYTEWPVPQREQYDSLLPEDRNVGKLFRRYPNGVVAYEYVIPLIHEAIRKYNDYARPKNEKDSVHLLGLLTDNDCVMLCSVFPEIKLDGYKKEFVEARAPLSSYERRVIRTMLKRWPHGVKDDNQ